MSKIFCLQCDSSDVQIEDIGIRCKHCNFATEYDLTGIGFSWYRRNTLSPLPLWNPYPNYCLLVVSWEEVL